MKSREIWSGSSSIDGALHVDRRMYLFSDFPFNHAIFYIALDKTVSSQQSCELVYLEK